jgi:hypothetical protein
MPRSQNGRLDVMFWLGQSCFIFYSMVLLEYVIKVCAKHLVGYQYLIFYIRHLIFYWYSFNTNFHKFNYVSTNSEELQVNLMSVYHKGIVTRQSVHLLSSQNERTCKSIANCFGYTTLNEETIILWGHGQYRHCNCAFGGKGIYSWIVNNVVLAQLAMGNIELAIYSPMWFA